MTTRFEQENESYFQKLTDNLPVMIWKTDSNGYCLYLNQQWYDFTGQTRQEAIGMRWEMAVHPDDMEKSRRIFKEATEQQKSFKIHYSLKNKDGQYHYMTDMGCPRFDEAGNFEGYLGIIVDVHEQKIAEIALEESEMRHRLTVEVAGMGTWEYDLETDMVRCSGKTREIFGLTEEVVPVARILDAIDPFYRDNIKHGIAMAFLHKESDYQMEYQIGNKLDGSKRAVMADGKVFFNSAGKPAKFIGTCLDVTRNKQIEEKIRVSEERYRHMFENSPVALCEEDLSFMRTEVLRLKNNGVHDFHSYFRDKPGELFRLAESIVIKDLNSAILKLVETDSKDEVKQGLHKIFIEDTTKSFLQQFDVIAAGGGHFEHETVIRTFKGNFVEVLIHLQFPRSEDYSSVLISLVDISIKRKAEKELKESEGGFRELYNAMPQLVWIANAEGLVTYYNERLNEFSGANKNSDGSWSWSGLVHPDDDAITMAAWQNAISSGETYQVEHRVKMKDGRYRWFLSRGVPLKDNNGRVSKWLGTATDIHNSREHAQLLEDEVIRRTSELHEMNSVLQESNLELQQFVHVASHDLREPLRKIKIFMDLLLKDPANSFTDKSRVYAEKVNSAVNRMYNMLEGVLKYSALNGNGQVIEAIQLPDIIREVITDLELLITQKNASIQYSNLPVLDGSAALLHQLFYNLINNSLKFTKPDVRPLIEISAEIVNDDNEDMVLISVQDNGIGFRQEFAERIFKSFSRLNTKDRFEGSGLGLSLCKRIVQRHGGSITAFGGAGTGAKFLITLPIRQRNLSI